MNSNRDDALARMRLSLEGLSVGDAFGELYFGGHGSVEAYLETNELPPGPWWYSDDSEQALGIFGILKEHGEINQDALAAELTRRYVREPMRGYGNGARRYFASMELGMTWQASAQHTFKGGSMGNGSAMRIAPLGAFFADRELSVIVEQAARSAEVSHAHAEGIAGAIAVALAAAITHQMKEKAGTEVAAAIFEKVLELVPKGQTWEKIETASRLSPETLPERAANILGNGSLVTCPDTVPFVLWSACRGFKDYRQALHDTVAAGGDRDTTCAMVGGIVALYVGMDGIPAEFLERREKLNFE